MLLMTHFLFYSLCLRHQFEVAGYDAEERNITFGRGGYQGARGDDSGGDFYIENIFEEVRRGTEEEDESIPLRV